MFKLHHVALIHGSIASLPETESATAALLKPAT
jgi:hypothetical protein